MKRTLHGAIKRMELAALSDPTSLDIEDLQLIMNELMRQQREKSMNRDPAELYRESKMDEFLAYLQPTK